MGNKGRWEYLRAIYERYRKAGRKEKKVILSEFCANTGYHRKYAIRLLNGPRPEKRWRRTERRRGLTYSQETLALLTAVWEAAGYPWSVRLKALLPLWMPWIRQRFRLRPGVEKQLLKISARQMDRRLAEQKTQRRRSIYGRTKPGYWLKHHNRLVKHGQSEGTCATRLFPHLLESRGRRPPCGISAGYWDTHPGSLNGGSAGA